MTLAVNLTNDAAWPWSLSAIGLPALALVAAILVALTIWTYLGVPGASFRRILIVLGIRLAALALAVLALWRPALAFKDGLRVPSTLLIVVDGSESMTTNDEFDGSSRWAYLQRTLKECEPSLQRLHDEQNVTVVFQRFGADVGDWDPKDPGKADSPRTDFGKMLDKLYTRYRGEGHLRGLIVLSDGADNGNTEPPMPVAARWRNLPCPIHTVGFGKTTTDDKTRDVALVNIATEPPEVPIKNELIVKGTIDASGFEGSRVRIQLFLNDKPEAVDTLDTKLPLARGNQVKLKCVAPDTPGEMKVTLKVEPLHGELTTANNEISTYVTVTKEGVSVLLVERGDRFAEPQLMCDALRADKRIRLTTSWFRDDRNVVASPDYFQLDKQHYDVIIIGDVSAAQMKARDPESLNKIFELVEKKGVGLLMTAGQFSFGNGDWKDTKIAQLLPVELDVRGQMDGLMKLTPTIQGWERQVVRFGERDRNDQVWKALSEVDGMTRLGKLKPRAFVVLEAREVPVLVAEDFTATARTMALAVDTSHRWIVDEQGRDNHRRFWQQLILWLAHQEVAEGHVWIEPERRRLAVGDKFRFTTGLRDKRGDKVPGGEFSVKVLTPSKAEVAVDMTREDMGERGIFWKTDEPGEYQLLVAGKGKDKEGNPIPIDPKAAPVPLRFLVYPNTSEMGKKAADHDFLRSLASTGGGRFLEAQELARFLQQLENEPLPQSRPKTAVWPDWNRSPETWRRTGKTQLPSSGAELSDHLGAMTSSGMLPCFALFTGLLSLEWFLRRRWGLV